MCLIHCLSGAGHDMGFPLRILIDFVNHVLKLLDKCDCEGRKRPVEIYVCRMLIETGYGT